MTTYIATISDYNDYFAQDRSEEMVLVHPDMPQLDEIDDDTAYWEAMGEIADIFQEVNDIEFGWEVRRQFIEDFADYYDPSKG